MSALEKRLKEFQKKAGNRNCFVCNQKVIHANDELSLGSSVFCDGFPHSGVHWMQWSPVSCVCIVSCCSRSFSHTIKHLTLATWTKEEVDLVVTGGNKVCVISPR